MWKEGKKEGRKEEKRCEKGEEGEGREKGNEGKVKWVWATHRSLIANTVKLGQKGSHNRCTC
jgi:hypothetical protein